MQKLKEDVSKFVDDEVCYLPDEVHCRSFSGYASLKKELLDFGMDLRKNHTPFPLSPLVGQGKGEEMF